MMMYHLKIEVAPSQPVVLMKDLQVGDLVKVHEFERFCLPGEILLRTHTEVVSLNDPSRTWPNVDSCPIRLVKLTKGETVVLEVK